MTDPGMPSRFESEAAPPESLFSRVRAAVAATPAAKTSTRIRVGIAMAVIPLVTAAVLLVASQLVYDRPALRTGMGTTPTFELLLVLLLVVGLTLTATLVAVARGQRGLGPGMMPLLLVALLVTPIYAVFALAIPLHTSQAAAASLAELSPWGLRCLAIASAVGLLVLVSFTAALRRSAPVATRLRGAALGAAAGTWAGLAVFVFCPAIEHRHLLVGHVLPIAIFTLIGLAVIPRALRP
jgi:hypothetical protein